jgi:hypothetical protein
MKKIYNRIPTPDELVDCGEAAGDYEFLVFIIHT